jgi:hypothetical protein
MTLPSINQSMQAKGRENGSEEQQGRKQALEDQAKDIPSTCCSNGAIPRTYRGREGNHNQKSKEFLSPSLTAPFTRWLCTSTPLLMRSSRLQEILEKAPCKGVQYANQEQEDGYPKPEEPDAFHWSLPAIAGCKQNGARSLSSLTREERDLAP